MKKFKYYKHFIFHALIIFTGIFILILMAKIYNYFFSIFFFTFKTIIYNMPKLYSIINIVNTNAYQ